MMVKDKKLVRRQFSRGICTYNQSAVVQKQVCEKLSNKLIDYLGDEVKRIFEIGCGTGFLTLEMMSRFRPFEYFANDIIINSEFELDQIFREKGFERWNFIEGDAEEIDFPMGMDLVVSTSAVQWFNDFERFVQRAYESLKPGGMLAFSTFGPENYKEIKATTGFSLNYNSLQYHKEIISKYFEVSDSEESISMQWFATPIDVLKHIKTIGANGIVNAAWGKGRMKIFEEQYQRQFSFNGNGVKLTYHPMIFICRKIAES